MATGIFCSVADVQKFVGANASTVSNTEAYIDVYTSCAESYINAVTGKNFSDTYASLNADKKGILKLAASCWTAIMVLNYDPTEMSAREFETRIDVLTMLFNKAMQQLKEPSVIKFVSDA